MERSTQVALCVNCFQAKRAIDKEEPGWRERAALELDLCEIGGCDPEMWVFLEGQPELSTDAINQRHKDRCRAALESGEYDSYITMPSKIFHDSQEILRKEFMEMMHTTVVHRKKKDRVPDRRPQQAKHPVTTKQQPAQEPGDEWLDEL